LEVKIVGSGNNSALDNAANDANQNLSSAAAGSPVQSCGPPPPADTVVSPDKKHWIAIELIDEAGQRIPDEDYRITLPDGTIVEGCLDEKGRARIAGIDSGNCKVTFPSRDKEAWKPA